VKRWLVLVACLMSGVVLASAAGAQTHSPAQQFYGMWYTYPLGNPATDPIRHEFRHNAATGKDEMIVTRLCNGDYRSVIARVVSPIEISENTIRVLKSASDTEPGVGTAECRVSIKAGQMSYTLSADGNRITLTNPGGHPDLLELARQDETSEATLPPSLYGSWLLPAHLENNATIQVRLVFYNSPDSGRGTVRQIATCSKDNRSLLSRVDSAIKITPDEITFLDSASHVERDGPFTCTASIRPETLHYAVSANGETMTLSKAGQKPIILTRAH